MDKPHKRLDVWRCAMKLVKRIYHTTQVFPAEEKYGLTQQMRRAAVSIASNIAEGAARRGTKELRQFSTIARASLSELDTQADIAMMLTFLSREERLELDTLMTRIDKMLYRLIQTC